MKSTGEVMGIGETFAEAFGKSQLAAGTLLPDGGCALLSVRDEDKEQTIRIAKDLLALGFSLVATRGTARCLNESGLQCQAVNKVRQGHPHIVDMIIAGQIDLIVNTTEDRQAIADSFTIRREALQHKVCYTTTMEGAWALKEAIQSRGQYNVYCLQDLHAGRLRQSSHSGCSPLNFWHLGVLVWTEFLSQCVVLNCCARNYRNLNQ